MATQSMVMRSIDPATEEVLATFEPFSSGQIDAALEQAYRAQQHWRQTPFEARAACLRAAARVLRSERSRWATLMTREMGKPIVEAEAEIDKCAWNCDFYAEHAQQFLADEPVQTNARESFVAFEPLGVVLAIMPWNFPFWQVFRFAAPALMAGNGAVLKHASNVPQCALAIEQVFRQAGLPEGLFRTVLVPGSAVERLIADPRIHAVTLTGSSAAGEQVASAAGRQLKKQVLELGGSDPFVVLADADLDLAASTAARATRTAARAASPPSASSWKSGWRTPSSPSSPRRSRRCGSVIHWSGTPTSGRWRGETCARRSRTKSNARGRRGPRCGWAGRRWTAAATSTPRPFWKG